MNYTYSAKRKVNGVIQSICIVWNKTNTIYSTVQSKFDAWVNAIIGQDYSGWTERGNAEKISINKTGETVASYLNNTGAYGDVRVIIHNTRANYPRHGSFKVKELTPSTFGISYHSELAGIFGADPDQHCVMASVIITLHD